MKKLIVLMMTTLLSLSTLAGCSTKSKESVTTDGSTSMEKVGGARYCLFFCVKKLYTFLKEDSF